LPVVKLADHVSSGAAISRELFATRFPFAGLEIKYFSQEQYCSWVQNFRSKFGLTRSRKYIYYENGPEVE